MKKERHTATNFVGKSCFWASFGLVLRAIYGNWICFKYAKSYWTGLSQDRGVSPRADLFSSTLSCNKKEEKSHQTFALAGPFPSIRQLCACAPLSINQATLRARAPFSQQDKNSTISILHLNFPLHNTWPGTSFYLPQQLIQPPSLTPRPKEPTHPSSPFGRGGLGVRPLASVWTFGDHPGCHTEVRIKHDFTPVPESSWLWRKLLQKVQLFQREGGGMVYWPACRDACKRKSWGAWFSVCSQWWTPPHPSWTQPELHQLDTVC